MGVLQQRHVGHGKFNISEFGYRVRANLHILKGHTWDVVVMTRWRVRLVGNTLSRSRSLAVTMTLALTLIGPRAVVVAGEATLAAVIVVVAVATVIVGGVVVSGIVVAVIIADVGTCGREQA